MKNTVFGYKVTIDSICTSSFSSEEMYGEWGTESENIFKSISKTKDHPDIVSSLDIKEGEECFVVWAEWSSGDSFGQAYRGSCEPLAIFKDHQSAKAFSKVCEDSKNYRVTVNTPDGQIIEVFVAWGGYFENLEAIRIENVAMSDIKYNTQ